MLTVFAGVALVTGFTDTGTMTTVTLQSVLLEALTLLRAARSESPLRTSWMRKFRRNELQQDSISHQESDQQCCTDRHKRLWYHTWIVATITVFRSSLFCMWILVILEKQSGCFDIFGICGWEVRGWWNVWTAGLTQVAEAPIQARITQTCSVGPMTATVICTVTLLVALLPIESLWTAWKQLTVRSCCG